MIKPLTSLRFIFAFLVFLSHYVVDGSSLFSEGYIGVSFFFILSGFVLSYSYKERFLDGVTTKREFFIARFARIYPLHFATFLASFAIAFLATAPIQWGEAAANVTLLQAWIPSQDYYFSFNSPSWSISDEMFFYLMFPFLILFLYKAKSVIKWVSLIVAASCYIVAMILMSDSAEVSHAYAYISPMFRILDFVVGIGVYKLWYKTKNSIRFTSWLSNVWMATVLEIFSIGLLVVMVVFSYDLPQVVRYSCYYWLPMALVIFIFAQKNSIGLISQFFSWKPLVLLGEISFGFYMIHQLALGIIMRFFNIVGLGNLAWQIKFVIVALLITFVSWISFKYFETPCNKWIKNRYKLYKSRLNA